MQRQIKRGEKMVSIMNLSVPPLTIISTAGSMLLTSAEDSSNIPLWWFLVVPPMIEELTSLRTMTDPPVTILSFT